MIKQSSMLPQDKYNHSLCFTVFKLVHRLLAVHVKSLTIKKTILGKVNVEGMHIHICALCNTNVAPLSSIAVSY